VLRSVQILRYVAPLREGGSLPAVVEADDDGTYVAKFSGAGHGTAALIAEVLVGELARRLGIRVPELVLAELDPGIAKLEPDPEIQHLLKASAGLNLGVDFLPGSVGYDGITWQPDPDEAARIVWLDAYTANIDRTWRNPNLLIWHRQLWAIDHGAALVFQHAWPPVQAWAARRYDLSDHILLGRAGVMDDGASAEVDAALTAAVTPGVLEEVLALVPDVWLGHDPGATRTLYGRYLTARLEPPRAWRAGWSG
jgi:hypothetical protein